MPQTGHPPTPSMNVPGNVSTRERRLRRLKTAAGAVSGLVAAFLVDLHAWAHGSGAYDWAKASKRWIAGGVSGALAAIGYGGMTA